MKSIPSMLAAIVVSLSLLLTQAACTEQAGEPVAENPALATPAPEGMVRGTVLETMDAGGYTYVLVDLGEEQRWMAAPPTEVAVGDIVQTMEGMPMGQFQSQTLGRTFDNIYFVGVISNLSNPTLPQGHPTIDADAAPADVAVAAAEEGKDIAWVYANKDSLAGQPVSLRGKVVKYNANILGTNWLHIQDGSGSAADGSNDLIVTSAAEVAVGDTVVVSGNIVLDKDFGAGYSYPVLMADATVVAE